MSMDNIELSSKNYWDDLWEDADCQGSYIFNQKNPSYVLNYKKHVIMKNYLSDVPEGSSFLEVGCGASKFLAYVSQQFHYDVSGIDYSEEGCYKARKILENNGVEGTIILGDMFNLSKDERYRGRFDVVYTGGVIEHFDDTNHVVKTISDFAGDGGYVITTVPNTWKKSLNMIIQKVISKETYDIHKELSLSDIRDAHEKAGLSVLMCEYVCFISLGSVNFVSEKFRKHPFFYKVIRKLILIANDIVYYVSDFLKLRPNRFTSPAIVCIAKKRNGN